MDRKIIRVKGLVEQKIEEAAMEEALAMRCALRMAQNAGWTKIEVQSDCKVVVD